MHFHSRLVFVLCLFYFVPGSLFGAFTLQLDQNSVDVNANAGTTKPVSDNSTSLSATGSGSANITISISNNAPWLSASPSSRTITAGGPSVTITVSANPTGLHANNYKGTVTISGGGSSVTLTVNFAVNGVDISASLRASFAPIIAGQQSPANAITVSVANNGRATVQITVNADNGGSWLVVNNNQTTAQAPASIPVVVDASSARGAANYNGNITFSCTGGSPCLPVTVSISVSIIAQPITASPTSLTFSTSSASAQQPQMVSLASGGSPVSFTVSQSQASIAWLSFTSSSMTTPATLTVSVSGAALRQQAIYSGSILITPSNGGAVVNVSVSYDFSPPATGGGGFTSGGSMAQVASGGFWTTTFTLVNNGATATQIHMNFFDDNGNPLPLPLIFPQTSPTPAAPAATLDRMVNAGAMLIVQTTGPNTQTVQAGWAQLLYNGNVSAYSVFGQTIGGPAQEAVVPLETRTASSFVIPFDTTGGYATGVALANASTAAANIPVLIRDDNGALLQSTSLGLAAQGHTSFDLVSRFGVTAQRRGTLEFQTPAGSQVSVLGLRFPPGPAFSTIPALAK
jgi:Viral BACON domain